MNTFVGRKEQLEHFGDIIDRMLRSGPVSSKIFEYYGPPGIGKTALMQREQQVATLKGASVAWVDFGARQWKGLENNPLPILDSISAMLGTDSSGLEVVRERGKRIGLPNNLVKAYDKLDQEERLYRSPEWLTHVREVVIEFIKSVNLHGVPTVMFFDGLDNASTPLLDWVEEWVVNPAIQIRHNLVLTGVRRPWWWKRPEVRRRLTSQQLSTLDRGEVEIWCNKELGQARSSYVDQIYRATHGYPGAIRKALDHEKR